MSRHQKRRKTGLGTDLYGALVDGFLASLAGTDVNPKLRFYQTDPVAWFVDRLEVKEEMLRWSLYPEYREHKWDGDFDPLASVLQSLAEGRDVGVESGTGTGKTFLGAGIVMWWLECFEDSIVITLAPKADQLKLHIWKEIAAQWPKFAIHHPLATLTSLKLTMAGTESWAATVFPVQVRAGEDVAAKAAGFHAEHMLFIFEETQGVDTAVMTAVENTTTADHNLRCGLGNPDHQADTLHQFCTQPKVTHIQISALDHPNIVTGNPNTIPGAVAPKKIEERKGRYGQESRLYRSRVRGICATESTESIIRWSWLTDAAKRELTDIPEDLRKGPPALGVDVANSPNGDEQSIASGIGPRLLVVETAPCDNSNELGALINTLMGTGGIDERNVGVDAIGVGAGTVNELTRLKKSVYAIQSAASPLPHSEEEEFGNLRAQMWWQFRLDAQHGHIILPYDEELFQELSIPTWRNRGGKIYVESKDDLRKRLKRSPNKADAAVYWNWVRKTRTVATGKVSMVDF